MDKSIDDSASLILLRNFKPLRLAGLLAPGSALAHYIMALNPGFSI